MQDDVRATGDAVDAQVAGRRMEERNQLGGAMPKVFMWLTSRLTDGLPVATGLRNSLVGAGFVHAPDGQPQLLALGIGLLDQTFFALASGSWTSTSPRLRLRMAAPVW